MTARPDAIYGAPLDGENVVQVPVDLAPLFADAHQRIRTRPAAVHTGDGAVRIAAREPGEAWAAPGDDVVDALASAASPAVLAGPGVVLDNAIPGLHALAAAGSLGVLNTWGAKGIFDWRSRHHLATVGLQALDFERGGLGDADLIIATGIDEREAVADWRLAPVLEVAPRTLGPLGERWGRPRHDIAVPPLRADLARITQAGWAVDGPPLPPTRATRHYSLVFGEGGLVAADPGTAGYWVARTFATSGIGGAQVPSDPSAAGFAIACCIVARLLEPARPVLAAVDAIGDVHERLLDVGRRFGVNVPVEVWSPGDPIDAATHLDRLETIAVQGGRVTVATDPTQLEEMLAVAGPIVAWTANF